MNSFNMLILGSYRHFENIYDQRNVTESIYTRSITDRVINYCLKYLSLMKILK